MTVFGPELLRLSRKTWIRGYSPFTAVISRGRTEAVPQNYRSFEGVFSL
jgi:hypothetical protein